MSKRKERDGDDDGEGKAVDEEAVKKARGVTAQESAPSAAIKAALENGTFPVIVK